VFGRGRDVSRQIVEIAPARALFTAPRHPIRRRWFAAIPDPGGRRRSTARLDGSPTSHRSGSNACRFLRPLSKGADICTKAMPPLRRGRPDFTFAACHFALSPMEEPIER